MAFDITVMLVGVVGALGILLIVGYFLYDKNPVLAGLLIIIGLLLVVAFVISEIYFKKQRQDAPWQYR